MQSILASAARRGAIGAALEGPFQVVGLTFRSQRHCVSLLTLLFCAAAHDTDCIVIQSKKVVYM